MSLGRFPVLLLSVLITATFLSGCGEESADELSEVREDPGIDALHVSFTDTIGVEMGDSSCVFALLMSACYGPEGNVLSLDGQKCCVSAFSPEGEHLYDVGRWDSLRNP